MTRYRWDAFQLDLDRFRLERDGVPVPLEPKAIHVLALLAARPDHVFTKQEIFEAVWPDTAVTDHALTRVIAQLRKALGDDAREARYIETVPTRGYRWLAKTQLDSAASPLAPAAVSGPAPPPAARVPAGGRPPAALWLIAAAVVLLGALLASRLASPALTPAATAASGATAGGRGGDVVWPVQVTTHAGLDLEPAFSPADQVVAFVSDRTGSFEIYVRDLATAGAEVAITTDGGGNVHPAWSPDGRWLAFHSSRRGGVWVVPARGGVARQVAPVGSHPAWAPDGRRLAFQSDEFTDVTPSAFGAHGGSTLWVVDVEGGAPRPLTQPGTPPGGHGLPAWSHDGRWIAFVAFDAGAANGLWVLDVARGVARQLDAGSGLYEAAFAPDGSAVYAAAGEAFVARVPFDAGTGRASGPREMLPVPGVPGVRGLSVAPDGRRLAFAGLSLDSQIWAQPITADGSPRGAARPLTADTSRRKSLPAVAPDGTRVAYMSSRRGQAPDIWVLPLDEGEPLAVTSGEQPEGEPAWAPDGRRLLYVSPGPEGRVGLWSVDTATRHRALVARWPERDAPLPEGARRPRGRLAELRVSPSMTHVAFTVLAPPQGLRQLFVSDLAAFRPRALTAATAWTGYPAWAPDESALAVEIKDGPSTQAAILDLASGALRQITTGRGHTWVRSWSPDGRRLAAATLREGRWSLRWLAADGGADGEMLPPTPPSVYVRYPEWSPRGDLVVFEPGDLRGNIWMLPLPSR